MIQQAVKDKEMLKYFEWCFMFLKEEPMCSRELSRFALFSCSNRFWVIQTNRDVLECTVKGTNCRKINKGLLKTFLSKIYGILYWSLP